MRPRHCARGVASRMARHHVLEPTRGSAPGGMWRLVRRIVINRWRWRGGRREALTDHVPGATVEDMAHQTADRQLVEAALQTLPTEQREALFETYFRRASVDQAADMLGVSPATVMARTHDALH